MEAARAEEPVSTSQGNRRSTTAHFCNLNEDPMLSGVICHFLEDDTTVIGRDDENGQPNIALKVK